MSPTEELNSVAQGSEPALLAYAKRLERHKKDRRAVHVHLSRLRPHNRREHHIRIAANSFERLAQGYDGEVFILSNSDILFSCKGAKLADIDKAVLEVRYLFSEDPLTQLDDEPQGEDLCTWYDIEAEYDEFLKLATHLHAEQERRERLIEEESKKRGPAKKRAAAPLEPAQLAQVEDILARADMSNFMRRQPVCAISADSDPQVVFHEVYVSIADLQEQLTPDINLVSDRWLFQRLTQTLDRRMMTLVCAHDDSTIASYFSINLNVSTLLSPEFLKFDNNLRSGARGTVVLELPVVDIFSDMGAYAFARDFVHERGYRVCLDGLTHLTAPFIDRVKLGLDLVKVYWSRDMLDDASGRRRESLREMIEQSGQARVILCRCGSDDAIEFGRSLGISLFQGKAVDARRATQARNGGAMTMNESRARGAARGIG